MDGWDDTDAHVACKELGYTQGFAYNAARSTLGPYWTSNVQCQGTEARLADCQLTEFGEVTECKNVLSHAGVICFSDNGKRETLINTIHFIDDSTRNVQEHNSFITIIVVAF